jgi:hypothetical protein
MREPEMRRTIPRPALIVTSLLLSACATTVSVKVTKPAEINMAGNRIVAVLDFRYPETGMSGADLFRWALSQLTGIEIYREKSVEERVADYATAQVISTLLDTAYFQLVSPNDVATAMRGRIDANTSPMDVGQAVQAQAIVNGELYVLESEDDRWVEQKRATDPATGIETVENVFMISRKVKVGMRYQVVNTRTGLMVASRSFEGTDEVETPMARLYVLPSPEDLYKSVIDRFMPVLARHLAPYQVTEYRSMMRDKSKDPRVAQGVELLRDRLYDQALEVFLQVFRESGNTAAGYDAAIVYEITGRLNQALTQMQEVVQRTGERKAVRAYTRLQAAKQEQERLIEQQR